MKIFSKECMETGSNNDEKFSSAAETKSNIVISKICSCKEFLSVPLQIIFCIGPDGRPLLSRPESLALIRVSGLACEMDILIDSFSYAQEKRMQRKLIQEEIKHMPTFWSLETYLSIHGKTIYEASRNLETGIARVFDQLSYEGQFLKSLSEVNWTFNGYKAREKHILGEIEEEIAQRIEELKRVIYEEDFSDIKFGSFFNEKDVSMKYFCECLFKQQREEQENFSINNNLSKKKRSLHHECHGGSSCLEEEQQIDDDLETAEFLSTQISDSCRNSQNSCDSRKLLTSSPKIADEGKLELQKKEEQKREQDDVVQEGKQTKCASSKVHEADQENMIKSKKKLMEESLKKDGKLATPEEQQSLNSASLNDETQVLVEGIEDVANTQTAINTLASMCDV